MSDCRPVPDVRKYITVVKHVRFMPGTNDTNKNVSESEVRLLIDKTRQIFGMMNLRKKKLLIF